MFVDKVYNFKLLKNIRGSKTSVNIIQNVKKSVISRDDGR